MLGEKEIFKVDDFPLSKKISKPPKGGFFNGLI